MQAELVYPYDIQEGLVGIKQERIPKEESWFSLEDWLGILVKSAIVDCGLWIVAR